MSPQRARTYCWLFVALSLSVTANILVFQTKPQTRGAAGVHRDTAAGGSEAIPIRIATTARAIQPSPLSPSKNADQIAETVRAIQRELKELDFYPGQVDGKPSMLTTAAVVAYEQTQALPLTGEPSQSLLRALIIGPAAMPAATGYGMGVAPGSAAEKLMREIRQRLVALGYAVGHADGRLSLELIQAIRAFEADNGQRQTGRVTANLLLQVQRGTSALRLRPGG